LYHFGLRRLTLSISSCSFDRYCHGFEESTGRMNMRNRWSSWHMELPENINRPGILSQGGAGDQLDYLGRVFGLLEFRPHALYRCRSVCRRKSCPCPWSRLEHIRDTVDLHGIRRNRIRASRTDTGVSPLALAGNLFCHRHAGVG